jgi:hypothetical protein
MNLELIPIWFIAWFSVCYFLYGLFDNGKRSAKENLKTILVLSIFLALFSAGLTA